MSELTVNDFISQQPENQQVLLSRLRDLIKETEPAFEESIKWGKPHYSVRKPVCYLAAQKNHVNLGFYEGGLLPDPDKLLEGTGAKMLHIKIKTTADIQETKILKLIKSAVNQQNK